MDIIATDRPTFTPWSLYRSLVGLGVVCAFLIAVVYSATAPAIKRNQAEALRAAIFEVLPGALQQRSLRLEDDRLAFTKQVESTVLYSAYDANGSLVGIAVEAKGMGYQDEIHLIYGYSPERQQLVGMKILRSRETPGLGDRIASYPSFVDSFSGLDVSLDDSGKSLEHRLVTVSEGTRTRNWEVDGITGATISANAVTRIIEQSTAQWLPVLVSQHTRIRALPDG